jgi:hypothetical protein
MPQASIVIDVIKAGLVSLSVAAFLFTAAGVVGSLAHMVTRRLNLPADDAERLLDQASVDFLRAGFGFILLAIGLMIEAGIPETLYSHYWIDDLYTGLPVVILAMTFLIKAVWSLRRLLISRR